MIEDRGDIGRLREEEMLEDEREEEMEHHRRRESREVKTFSGMGKTLNVCCETRAHEIFFSKQYTKYRAP